MHNFSLNAIIMKWTGDVKTQHNHEHRTYHKSSIVRLTMIGLLFFSLLNCEWCRSARWCIVHTNKQCRRQCVSQVNVLLCAQLYLAARSYGCYRCTVRLQWHIAHCTVYMTHTTHIAGGWIWLQINLLYSSTFGLAPQLLLDVLWPDETQTCLISDIVEVGKALVGVRKQTMPHVMALFCCPAAAAGCRLQFHESENYEYYLN